MTAYRNGIDVIPPPLRWLPLSLTLSSKDGHHRRPTVGDESIQQAAGFTVQTMYTTSVNVFLWRGNIPMDPSKVNKDSFPLGWIRLIPDRFSTDNNF